MFASELERTICDDGPDTLTTGRQMDILHTSDVVEQ